MARKYSACRHHPELIMPEELGSCCFSTVEQHTQQGPFLSFKTDSEVMFPASQTCHVLPVTIGQDVES